MATTQKTREPGHRARNDVCRGPVAAQPQQETTPETAASDPRPCSGVSAPRPLLSLWLQPPQPPRITRRSVHGAGGKRVQGHNRKRPAMRRGIRLFQQQKDKSKGIPDLRLPGAQRKPPWWLRLGGNRDAGEGPTPVGTLSSGVDAVGMRSSGTRWCPARWPCHTRKLTCPDCGDGVLLDLIVAMIQCRGEISRTHAIVHVITPA